MWDTPIFTVSNTGLLVVFDNKKLLQYDEVDKSLFATYYEYALHFIDSNDKKLTNELVVSINMVLAETATSEKAKLIIRLSIWNFEISDWEAEKIQEVDMHVVNSTKLHCDTCYIFHRKV